MGSIKLDEYFKTKKNPSMKTVREHIHMKMDFFFHFYFKKFNAFDNIL